MMEILFQGCNLPTQWFIPPRCNSTAGSTGLQPRLSSCFTLFPCPLINYYSLQLNCALNVKYLGWKNSSLPLWVEISTNSLSGGIIIQGPLITYLASSRGRGVNKDLVEKRKKASQPVLGDRLVIVEWAAGCWRKLWVIKHLRDRCGTDSTWCSRGYCLIWRNRKCLSVWAI